MSRFDEKKQLRCSFCGKSQEQVKRLIAGPNVYICDECVELCQEIIKEEFEEIIDTEITGLPKPKEIKDYLDEYDLYKFAADMNALPPKDRLKAVNDMIGYLYPKMSSQEIKTTDNELIIKIVRE